MTNPEKNIPAFVALSGGVDSAVAAHLLKTQHSDLTGISHRHWPESRCCSTECVDRCAEQCRELGIPYFAVDCIVEFAKIVVDDFVSNYEHGLTPNPCVLCNENIRFDLMVRKHFQNKNLPLPKDYKLATGHYARVEKRENRFYLRRGRDTQKDQSYMLHRLSQEELSHCVFPLGDLLKSEVRALAAQFNLKSAKTKDSQDVCFVQDTYQNFIQQYSETQTPGNFVDPKGNILGQHKGIAFYTRGQRNGLGLSGGPWYVFKMNLEENTVVLSSREELLEKRFRANRLRWIYPEIPNAFDCMVQTRYHARENPCRIFHEAKDQIVVELADPSSEISPGQSAVFYMGDEVVGGGIITGFL
jgi:tRNA-specific 2-thiouridylase